MSVDDRLRRGLEANALAVLPEAEARLEAVHRRQRRRRVGLAVAASAVVLAAGAATAVVVDGRDSSAPLPTEPPPSSVPPAPASDAVPTGTWHRVVTTADARAAGVPGGARTEELLGPDGRLPERLSMTDETFSQEVQDQPGLWEVGDFGSISDDGGRLVMVSNSPGCPGCRATYAWRIEGDRLRLSDIQGANVKPIDRLMYEGVWTRGDS